MPSLNSEISNRKSGRGVVLVLIGAKSFIQCTYKMQRPNVCDTCEGHKLNLWKISSTRERFEYYQEITGEKKLFKST